MNDGNAFGNKYDTVCCPDVNSNFYAAVESVGNIKSHFFGHDHSNDFWGKHGDQKFYYGRKTGYGCYGPPEFIQKGARVLNLTEDASSKAGYRMDNYIIQEDLTIQSNHTSYNVLEKQDKCNVGLSYKRWGEALIKGEAFNIVDS